MGQPADAYLRHLDDTSGIPLGRHGLSPGASSHCRGRTSTGTRLPPDLVPHPGRRVEDQVLILRQISEGVMKKSGACIAAMVALSIVATAASAQTKSSVDKLYILNCGEGVAGDISRWSPGVNVGKSMDFVDNCYLIHDTQGWLLWDTGVADAIAAMPNGQAPADPRMTHWRRPKTLASELETLGVKPADIKYLDAAV